MIRIVIADDQQLMRDGLKALLVRSGDIQIVGEAKDGLEAVEMALRTQPDVVLMDAAMPGVNGVKATEQLSALDGQVKVLFVSGHSDHLILRQALKSGAQGYVMKSAKPEELVLAIRSVAGGKMYFSPEVFSYISEELVK